jgi:ubiquinone/menaquinone biosynthesis C-methylase UbiE
MPTTIQVADDWSAVAQAWDAKVDDLEDNTAAATEALVAGVAVRPGDRVLELGAGVGTLGAIWSQLAGPTGRVVLSDIAPRMVDASRRRNAHLANVETTILDASAIDQPDRSFDVVTCRMGLMFTPEPAQAFREIRRVLAPGGRFGALTWGSIELNPWMTCVGMAAMALGLIAGGPPVGPGGVFSLGDPTELESLANNAGFEHVAVTQYPTTFRAKDIDAHVARVSSLAGPLASAFASATAEQLESVRSTAAQLAADYITDAEIVFPGQALLVTGHT